MSDVYTYYAIGYDYQRPSEWFAGSEKEALTAFLTESKDNNRLRVRVVVETYMVDADSKVQHECKHGCAYHLFEKNTWIHTSWGPTKAMRKLASRLS